MLYIPASWVMPMAVLISLPVLDRGTMLPPIIVTQQKAIFATVSQVQHIPSPGGHTNTSSSRVSHAGQEYSCEGAAYH